VFREVFENDALQISGALSSRDLPEWDSLAQVRLIFALEEEFGIKFAIHEVSQFHTVGQLKRVVSRHTPPS
jgi:acyl carrier protein